MKIFNADKYDWLGVVRNPLTNKASYIFECRIDGFAPEYVLVDSAKIILNDIFVYLDSWLLRVIEDEMGNDELISPDQFINSLSVKCLELKNYRLAVNESNRKRRLMAYSKALAKICSSDSSPSAGRRVLHSV